MKYIYFAIVILIGLLFGLARYLALVGFIGLIMYPFGWWRGWVWYWILFIIIGLLASALYERSK